MSYEPTARQKRKGRRWLNRRIKRKEREAAKVAKQTRKHRVLWTARGYPNGCPNRHGGQGIKCGICPKPWEDPSS